MSKALGERIKSRMKIGEYRKVSNLAKSFRATTEEVRDCVHDTCGLDLIVGFRTGSGHGYYNISEYQIERYD